MLSRLLPLLTLSLRLPLPAAEFVRAFGTFPTDVSPRGIVVGPDGYFYGISANGPTRPGATFRIASDKGKFEVTRSFPATGTLPNFTRGGSGPDRLPVVSKDGCIYGLAKHGGLYGHGVIFQVRPDRDYAVIDLDPSQLLPELPVEDGTFVDSLDGLFEGQDRAFYSYHRSGALIRIGRDGVISKVADISHPGTAVTNYADPNSSSRIFSVSTNLPGGSTQRIHLLQISLASGAILKEISSADFTANPGAVTAFPSKQPGLLVHVAESSPSPLSGKLYRLEDSGDMTELATFGWPDNPALPPRMHKFIHAAADGTLYYSTSGQRGGGIAVQDGRSLIELKPDGSFQTICGFGDYPMFNVVEKDGYLYGATHGTSVYVPRNQAGYQEEWMSSANAANYSVVKGSAKGGFHFQVALSDPALLSAAPVVNHDLVTLRFGRDVAPVRVLRNDRDPEREGFLLLGVGSATHGSAHAGDNSIVSFFVMDMGRTSSIVSYQVVDKHSKVSTGLLLARGAPGNYRDDGLPAGKQPFTIKTKGKGRFHAKVPTGSGDSTIMISGVLDWNDEGIAGVRLPSGEVVTLYVAMKGGYGTEKRADYRIRQVDGSSITGTAALYFGR